MSARPPIGSVGERILQWKFGTQERATRFYSDQMLDHLNPAMIEFVGRQEIAFVATADADGECDNSLRTGEQGFMHVIDPRTLAYPEYRGNGVMASLGNIAENPHVGILLVDFVRDLVGLHINGSARIVEDEDLRAAVPDLPADHGGGRLSERWVVITVQEAYIHCRKHIPRMVPAPRHRCRGTYNAPSKGGDYFDAKSTPRQDESASTTVGVQRPATPAESTIRDATADAGDH